MEKLWGQFAPIAEQRVRVLQDMDVVRIGPLEVCAIETPGHASHHHVYQWEDNLFGGDIAGVRLGGGPPIPPFVPPELDVESWIESIQKVRSLHARKLYLPHFGPVEGPISEHLDELEKRVHRWANWFRDRMRAGQDGEQLTPAFAQQVVEELRAHGATEDEVHAYEAADPSFMAVTAAVRYWRKHHPEEVTSTASTG